MILTTASTKRIGQITFQIKIRMFLMLILGCSNGQIQQYDVRKGECVNFNTAHNFNITDLQISPDQSFIISSSADKTAQLHNARTLESLKKYKYVKICFFVVLNFRSGRPVNSAAISPIRGYHFYSKYTLF